ncbi:hypothetical protein PABG_11409 [Paracoccidioides brasiliensis Pb03]|nr:hypothetical protein PABG_11409 [Paracoccidioides brasiliensis Pb03]
MLHVCDNPHVQMREDDAYWVVRILRPLLDWFLWCRNPPDSKIAPRNVPGKVAVRTQLAQFSGSSRRSGVEGSGCGNAIMVHTVIVWHVVDSIEFTGVEVREEVIYDEPWFKVR